MPVRRFATRHSSILQLKTFLAPQMRGAHAACEALTPHERRSQRMRGAHAARGDLRSMTPAGVTFVLVASGFSVLRYVFRAVGKNTGYYTGSGIAF